MEDLLAEVKVRKERCERAIRDPNTSDLVRIRVLVPEHNILLLALEGYAASQKKGKQDLLSTRPATIVGPQMD
jgi:hypothetical protein